VRRVVGHEVANAIQVVATAKLAGLAEVVQPHVGLLGVPDRELDFVVKPTGLSTTVVATNYASPVTPLLPIRPRRPGTA
jgi:hypothetical protein